MTNDKKEKNMSKTVEVRIRADHEPKSRVLTEWPLDDLGSVISHIESWGLVDPNGDTRDGCLVGQFVVNDFGAYFEVVIVTEDE